VDDGGAVVGEERSASAATGLVHPLIRSAPIDPEARIALLKCIDASTALFYEGKHDRVTSIPTSATSTPVKPNKSFVPAMELPHLSDLMRKKGFGTNLSEVVDEAKRPLEFDEFESNDDESEEGESPVSGPSRLISGFNGEIPLPAMRIPAGASMSPAPFARPGSSKGADGMRTGRIPGVSVISPRPAFATPVINTVAAANHNKPSTQIANNHHDAMQIDEDHDPEIELYQPSHIDLSPNTSTSNNAPSLVSDDGEYDEGEDDAESATSEDEAEDSDVAEIDIEDGDGVDKVVPRTALRNRAGSGGEAMRLRKEEKEKHVTFVSPVKDVKERRNRVKQEH
jgi:ADA HAT complex component 1